MIIIGCELSWIRNLWQYISASIYWNDHIPDKQDEQETYCYCHLAYEQECIVFDKSAFKEVLCPFRFLPFPFSRTLSSALSNEYTAPQEGSKMNRNTVYFVIVIIHVKNHLKLFQFICSYQSNYNSYFYIYNGAYTQ